MSVRRIEYGVRGLFKRFTQAQQCPSCGSEMSVGLDRKGPYELRDCRQCSLQYRWPYETSEEMKIFYQRDYQQSGLTTELPSDAELEELLKVNFSGSQKDFSRIVRLLEIVSVPKKAKILDYGANWGYGVSQLNRAGFNATGYEISQPRATFGEKLGVKIYSDWSKIKSEGPFDVVFSPHVLEHTPDPAAAIKAKMSVLSPEGLFIAMFPNGSNVFRRADPEAFHRLWGKVHPFMLNEQFIERTLEGASLFVGAYCKQDLDALSKWERKSTQYGTLTSGEVLAIAYQKSL